MQNSSSNNPDKDGGAEKALPSFIVVLFVGVPGIGKSFLCQRVKDYVERTQDPKTGKKQLRLQIIGSDTIRHKLLLQLEKDNVKQEDQKEDPSPEPSSESLSEGKSEHSLHQSALSKYALELANNHTIDSLLMEELKAFIQRETELRQSLGKEAPPSVLMLDKNFYNDCIVQALVSGFLATSPQAQVSFRIVLPNDWSFLETGDSGSLLSPLCILHSLRSALERVKHSTLDNSNLFHTVCAFLHTLGRWRERGEDFIQTFQQQVLSLGAGERFNWGVVDWGFFQSGDTHTQQQLGFLWEAFKQGKSEELEVAQQLIKLAKDIDKAKRPLLDDEKLAHFVELLTK